jgi:hypothetical protein
VYRLASVLIVLGFEPESDCIQSNPNSVKSGNVSLSQSPVEASSIFNLNGLRPEHFVPSAADPGLQPIEWTIAGCLDHVVVHFCLN